MGREPREIHITVVPADIPHEEAIERLRQVTEILLRVQERVDRRKVALELHAVSRAEFVWVSSAGEFIEHRRDNGR